MLLQQAKCPAVMSVELLLHGGPACKACTQRSTEPPASPCQTLLQTALQQPVCYTLQQKQALCLCNSTFMTEHHGLVVQDASRQTECANASSQPGQDGHFGGQGSTANPTCHTSSPAALQALPASQTTRYDSFMPFVTDVFLPRVNYIES